MLTTEKNIAAGARPVRPNTGIWLRILMRKVTDQNVHTGAKSNFSSLVFNLHWIEILFFLFISLISVLAVVTLYDSGDLGKSENIVCCLRVYWSNTSGVRLIFFFAVSIAYFTIKRFKVQIEKIKVLLFQLLAGGIVQEVG